MTAAPIADRAVYHAIGALVICRVVVTTATATARVGYHSYNSCVWSRHGQEYSPWSWGGCLSAMGAMQRVKVRDKFIT